MPSDSEEKPKKGDEESFELKSLKQVYKCHLVVYFHFIYIFALK